MNFEIKDHKQVATLYLKGRLIGQHQSRPIIEAVEQHIENGTTHFVANLSEVSLINSTGLTVLLTILTKTRNAGGELLLSDITPQLSKLLIITKLNAIFTVSDTTENAQVTLQNMLNATTIDS